LPTAWHCGLRHELDWVAGNSKPNRAPGLRRLRRHHQDRHHFLRPGDAGRGDARAEAATLACDLFLAIGSSLVVYPAAGFPLMAKRNGARLVIVNREPTDLDGFADLVVHEDIGDVLEVFLP
jgi:NAD-dependent deacetylase